MVSRSTVSGTALWLSGSRTVVSYDSATAGVGRIHGVSVAAMTFGTPSSSGSISPTGSAVSGSRAGEDLDRVDARQLVGRLRVVDPLPPVEDPFDRDQALVAGLDVELDPHRLAQVEPAVQVAVLVGEDVGHERRDQLLVGEGDRERRRSGRIVGDRLGGEGPGVGARLVAGGAADGGPGSARREGARRHRVPAAPPRTDRSGRRARCTDRPSAAGRIDDERGHPHRHVRRTIVDVEDDLRRVGLDRQHAQIDHGRRIVEAAARRRRHDEGDQRQRPRVQNRPRTPKIGRIGIPTSGALSRNR